MRTRMRPTRGYDFQAEYIKSLENQILRAGNSFVWILREQLRNIVAGVSVERLTHSEAEDLMVTADTILNAVKNQLKTDINKSMRSLANDDFTIGEDWNNQNPLGVEVI